MNEFKDIKSIEEYMKGQTYKINQDLKGKNGVIFIGNSGVGQSTTINAILQGKGNVYLDYYDGHYHSIRYKTDVNGNKLFKIHHN